MTPTLLPAIDQLRLVAEGMDVIPNRVVHVQTNPLTSQFRVRVVDDFETRPFQNGGKLCLVGLESISRKFSSLDGVVTGYVQNPATWEQTQL